MSTTEAVKSVSIANLLQQRAAVVERIGKAYSLLLEAREIAERGHLGFPRIEYHCGAGSYSCDNTVTLPQLLKCVDAKGWRYLMEESGMRTFMDADARHAWDNKIHSLDVPALNGSNIEATFANLYESRQEIFERGVIQAFRSLSWHYKTNLPVRFGRKIIINRLCNSYPGMSNLYMEHQACDRLDDLNRVFHLLEERPVPDHRDGWYHVLSRAESGGLRETSGEFMMLRWFKKGSGHVVFKRPDLVDRLNAIIAKHYPDALPSPRESK